MNDVLRIRDLFELSSGTTVIACDRPARERSWSNVTARIVSDDGEQRRELVISGARSMQRQSLQLDQIAIETSVSLQLSPEEARSGRWLLLAPSSRI
jgi:hypothetical protein